MVMIIFFVMPDVAKVKKERRRLALLPLFIPD
jgi:hypothetical protein